MEQIRFSQDFADDVENYIKRQTIRVYARCRVGNKLRLFTEGEDKQYRKLLDAVCTKVETICITSDGLYIGAKNSRIGNNKRYLQEHDYDFARRDGFKDFEDLTNFFEQHYGLPFYGYVIHWKPDQGDKAHA